MNKGHFVGGAGLEPATRGFQCEVTRYIAIANARIVCVEYVFSALPLSYPPIILIQRTFVEPTGVEPAYLGFQASANNHLS